VCISLWRFATQECVKTIFTVTATLIACRKVPFSSRNDMLQANLESCKRRLVVMNKSDVAHASHQRVQCRKSGGLKVVLMKKQAIAERVRRESESTDVVFTCAKQAPSAKQLLSTVLAQASRDPSQLAVRNVMITGIPNVGKSTIINALQRAASASMREGKRAHGKPQQTGPGGVVWSGAPVNAFQESRDKMSLGAARTGAKPGMSWIRVSSNDAVPTRCRCYAVCGSPLALTPSACVTH
jgi:hypothetical protein